MLVLQAFAADDLLRHRTLLPARLGRLVAADVDIRRREQRDDFVQHVLQEREGLLGRAEDIVEHAPGGAGLERSRRAAQFRIGGERGQRVAGHFDFRDHRDVQPGRVGDHLAHLVLRVETAVWLAVAVGLPALSADLGQARVALDLDAPALVIGEMPMEPVELVVRHPIQHLLDQGDRELVAGHVQVHAAIGETRCVLDALRGHRKCRCMLQGQQLHQRLHTVELAGGVAAQGHALRLDMQRVGLRRSTLARRRQPHHVRRVCLTAAAGPQRPALLLTQPGVEQIGVGLGGLAVRAQPGGGGQHEAAGFRFDRCRQRHQ